jgi:uncharacterized protein
MTTWQKAARAQFPDGRWHFQHGPIDIVIGAVGDPLAITGAVERAWRRFEAILPELAGELAILRLPVQDAGALRGPVARRMLHACWPHREDFITPMAAVAGAVADELMPFFSADPGIRKAYVNNGGDIAVHLAPGEALRIGLYADLKRVANARQHLDGAFDMRAETPVRGVATSGWRGRSHSLGIADSVTVVARTAAQADAAATMIANSVNVDHPAIERARANSLRTDTDLGERLVTVDVGLLAPAAIRAALDAGVARAQALIDLRLAAGAVITLKDNYRVLGRFDNLMELAA